MIIYKFVDDRGRYIEINYCETGLYVEIDDGDGNIMTQQNIIIDEDGIESLKKYLNG